MVRLNRLAPLVPLLASLVLLFASCVPAKTPPAGQLSPEWITSSLESEATLTPQQKEAAAQLEPAGGEGRVAVGFTEDFDGDGRVESVSYGQYQKKDEEGNFVLVTRQEGGKTVVLLLQELPGPPRFTVFTLKPDGSLWFGGGIDAGEVTMNITWQDGAPTFRRLTAD